MKTRRIGAVLALTALLAGGSITLGCSGESNQPGCTTGTLSCPCYENSTCNTGLTCSENSCVSASGAGGSDTASPSGGASGTGETGGASGNSGGSGGGSTASCGDTQSDPNNCGACGRVCAAPAKFCPNGNCCSNGQCATDLVGCFGQESGFVNCAEYCGSLGESCVAAGCDGQTWIGYLLPSTCQKLDSAPDGGGWGACSEKISFGGGVARCCCTDNVP